MCKKIRWTRWINLGIFILFIILLLSNGGCSQLSYYRQAITGQMDVLARRQPITQVLTQTDLPEATRTKLNAALTMRRFATESLYLPDNGSYTDYADLQRRYAVWSVFAAPPLALEAKQWCFLMVGCLRYRGYFSEADAQALAEALRAEGYDVYIASVAAYSTLGWFDDPVLNTMLYWSRPHLAGVMFHELAHQFIYIDNDTAFNEGFAMAVQRIGTQRWLAQYGTEQEKARYQHYWQRQKQFLTLVQDLRQQLETLYAKTDLSDADKLQEKQRLFADLKARYIHLRETQWQNDRGYDHWFKRDLNNAKLMAIATYQDYVPAFLQLLRQKEGDLAQFYSAVKILGDLPVEQREKKINALLHQANTLLISNHE